MNPLDRGYTKENDAEQTLTDFQTTCLATQQSTFSFTRRKNKDKADQYANKAPSPVQRERGYFLPDRILTYDKMCEKT